MKSFLKNSGFALIGVLMAVLIIAALAYGSSFFWKNDTNTRMDANDANTIGQLEQAKDDLAEVNKTLEERNDLLNEEEGKITLTSIKSGDTLTSPATVAGTAAVPSNAIVVELRNQEHETMVKETVSVKNGAFAINLGFEFSHTEEGYVAVYELNPDSSKLNLVEIPVKFGN